MLDYPQHASQLFHVAVQHIALNHKLFCGSIYIVFFLLLYKNGTPSPNLWSHRPMSPNDIFMGIKTMSPNNMFLPDHIAVG
jgi:hypothetical protein